MESLLASQILMRDCCKRMYENIFKIIFCHLVGDYVLQSDFIARTKGENWYHLFIHSMLYSLPFYLCYGLDARLVVLIASHFLTDSYKARWKQIEYITDQVMHYLTAIGMYLCI